MKKGLIMQKMNMLAPTDIKGKVYDIIADTIAINKETIKDDKIFLYDDEMDMDSLDYMTIIVECEKAFNININDYEIEHIYTVGNLIKLIEKKNPDNIIVTKKQTRIQQFINKFKKTKKTISGKNNIQHTK